MGRTKRGLGKGLDALIGTSSQRTRRVMSELTQEVPVDQISPNPHQPRRHFDEEALAELAASIRTHGILQPLILARAEPTSPTPYYIIAGERRWRAARMAGLTHVPAIIKDASQQQLLEWALVENVQRENLNPLEAAAAYKSLMEAFGLTQAQVAERVGKSRVAVTNTLRLLNLVPEAQAALLEGSISEGHGRALLGLSDPQQQREALKMVLTRGLSVRETEALVRRMNRKEMNTAAASPSPPASLPPEWRAVEEALRQALGTKVEIRKSRRGGQVIIHFYSEEELHTLYEALTHPFTHD